MSAVNPQRVDAEPSSLEETVMLKEIQTDQENQTTDSEAIVRPKSQSPPPKFSPEALHFYSGNPCVEKVKGILHIYKDR